MTQIIALSWEYEVSTQPVLDQRSTSTRPALDQRKQNRRGSLEKLERTSSKLYSSSRNLNKSNRSLCDGC